MVIIGVDNWKTGVAPVLADGPLAWQTAGMAVCPDSRGRLSSEQRPRIVAWPVNRIDKTQFYFPVVEALADYVDVVGMTSGVLNFAPAEADLAIDSEEKRLLALVFSWLGNIFGYFATRSCALSISIPVGSPVVLSFKISPPKGFGVLLSILAMFSAALFAIAA